MRPCIAFSFLLALSSLANAQSSLTSSTPSKSSPKLPSISRANSGGTVQGGSDSCATPVAIAGQGSFAYDTTGATTGAEGQNECGAIHDDEWFLWTADADGIATISTCTDGHDTKLAAYPDTGACPADGTSLDCNDDSCSLQSSIAFPVTNGTNYLVQIGNFSLGAGAPGNLDILINTAADNDDCASPELIAGQGTFAFDTTGASTGAEGQNESICDFFGQIAIDNDVWFEWTSDDDGIARVETCNLAAHDTKLAAYDGSGCPADGTAIACNDDACAVQSSINFPVTNGTVYTLQVGSFPGASGGAGDISITISPPPPPACELGCDEALNQPPNQTNGLFADLGCDLCGTGVQSIAESVIFASDVDVCDIQIQSGYFPANVPVTDNLSLFVYEDAAGLPGTLFYMESNIPSTRVMTGNVLFGVDEWTHTLIPTSMPTVPAGKYWVEIFNDTGFGTDDFFWETGENDTAGGGTTADGVFATEAPGITWGATGEDHAMVICIESAGASYNRGIAEDRVVFQPLGGGVYDIVVTPYYYSLLTTPTDLSMDVVVSVNDVVVDVVPLTAAGTEQGNNCGGPCGEVDLCPPEAPCTSLGEFGQPGCACTLSSDVRVEFIALQHGDLVGVSLQPLPDALPEIFGPDDSVVVAFPFQGDYYCTANANSTGQPARITAIGSASASAGDLAMNSAPIPNQFGIFFHGANQVQVVFGNGFLCAAGNVIRGTLVSASGNLATYTYDNSDARHSLSNFVGSNRNFQFWFRDPMGGGAGFNTSDGLSLDILP